MMSHGKMARAFGMLFACFFILISLVGGGVVGMIVSAIFGVGWLLPAALSAVAIYFGCVWMLNR